MYPYMETVFFAAGIILDFSLWILYEDRKRRKIIRRKIRRIYGNVPEREYSPGDIETISHYFRRRRGGKFIIDDITWNDLDMDRVYMLINQTMSSPGEDVLYEMLRTPVFEKTEMDRREKLIRFFADNPEKREEMEILLSAVGKTRYGSLSDTILALEDAKEVAASPHWIMLFLLIAALGFIPRAACVRLSGFYTSELYKRGVLLCWKRQSRNRSISRMFFQPSENAWDRLPRGYGKLAGDRGAYGTNPPKE